MMRFLAHTRQNRAAKVIKYVEYYFFKYTFQSFRSRRSTIACFFLFPAHECTRKLTSTDVAERGRAVSFPVR